MVLFMASPLKDNIIQKIMCHIEYFDLFNNIYLFGSILDEEKYPNDIDLLLIYKNYSNDILIDLDKINHLFDYFYGISFDLTILSEREEQESEFLVRLQPNYLKLK